MALFWLSFCDPDKPEGSQFLGACIVEASHFFNAVPAATVLGINPGGEVEIRTIDGPCEAHVPRSWRNVLFRTREEALAVNEAHKVLHGTAP